MSGTEYRCTCGATLRYKQDMQKTEEGIVATWRCKDCDLPIPGMIAEKVKHQHP